MNFLFESYRKVVDSVFEFLGGNSVSEPAVRRTIQARALDAARGILPAATVSNVGVYGSGQAYEMLLMRLASSPLHEVRSMGHELHVELVDVIPSFVKRVGREDRGQVWIDYMRSTRESTERLTKDVFVDSYEPTKTGLVGDDDTGVYVQLVDWDKDGEEKIISAILQPHLNISDDDIWRKVLRMGPSQKKEIFQTYVGERKNRRHRPGRAFEYANYTFEIVVDYGAFRDLQRHRMLTVDWQEPTTINGYVMPELVSAAGVNNIFSSAMEKSEDLHATLSEHVAGVAQYATCMAHRIRFNMKMNARELMHLVELRSTPQGHPSYRTVAQKMFIEISATAQHHLVSEAMQHIDLSPNEEASRLTAEQRTEENKKNK